MDYISHLLLLPPLPYNSLLSGTSYRYFTRQVKKEEAWQ